MDGFSLTPADHIAIVAGIVVPAIAGIVAITVAIVRHVVRKSQTLDTIDRRVVALEDALAKEQEAAARTHRELYERLRAIDTHLAALGAKVDAALERVK